ncbi:MAG: BlaI/MecI/CopY family transcriptional regulator [Victivallaceae bacterium]|nr:BlaI/MecI/CopY family transcriptional regulator [Victivallaceae bacterium]
MKEIPGISEAEYEVMKVVWKKYPLTSGEIIEKLSPKKNWNPKTVKTLINRLVKKQALVHTAQGKAYLYSPAVSREACASRESESFIKRVFDGAMMPMLAHFAKANKIKPEDVERLKKILEEQN